MIRTSYMDQSTVARFVEAAQTPNELSACAVLNDLGLTVCDTQEEFHAVLATVPPQLLFSTFEERGLLVHARLQELPEFMPAPYPDFSSMSRWKASHLLWEVANRNGWDCDHKSHYYSCKVKTFLFKKYNAGSFKFLTDEQLKDVWRVFSRPLANTKVN